MYGNWNSQDRLLVTLTLASILHAVAILGVNFTLTKPPAITRALDITLVRSPSRAVPEKADFLAQDNVVGSGASEKKSLPKTEPLPQAGEGKQMQPAAKLTQMPAVKPRRLVKQEAPAEKKLAEDEGSELTSEEERPHLTADALSQQIADFSAEYNKAAQDQTHRPRMVYINSVTAQKYKAAAYEKGWQEKVERIGNLNYPDEARRRNLSGGLLLAVGIKPDGSIYSIQVRQSSGEPVLDEAAMRIVRLAAPFAAFPAELRDEVDVLVITRTWKFYNDNRMDTSR